MCGVLEYVYARSSILDGLAVAAGSALHCRPASIGGESERIAAIS